MPSAAVPADARDAPRPWATWGLMLLALLAAALLVDWSGDGAPRPLWVVASPLVLGAAGALFALLERRFWWAVISAAWGFVLIQVVAVATTLVASP